MNTTMFGGGIIRIASKSLKKIKKEQEKMAKEQKKSQAKEEKKAKREEAKIAGLSAKDMAALLEGRRIMEARRLAKIDEELRKGREELLSKHKLIDPTKKLLDPDRYKFLGVSEETKKGVIDYKFEYPCKGNAYLVVASTSHGIGKCETTEFRQIVGIRAADKRIFWRLIGPKKCSRCGGFHETQHIYSNDSDTAEVDAWWEQWELSQAVKPVRDGKKRDNGRL